MAMDSTETGSVPGAGDDVILIVDDDERTSRLERFVLEEEGFTVACVGSGEEALETLPTTVPSLILLDIGLPQMDGFTTCQKIRETSQVPIIMVTGVGHDEDKIRGLEMGADDYITKPFSPSELLARIEVAIRRKLLPDQVEVKPDFVIGDLRIDFAQRGVTLDGKTVSLTATEYKLLYELANHAGMVLTHNQILQRVWGPEYGGETELVRSFIRNLRRKLGDDARNPRYIFTEPQVGYRIPRPSA